MSLAHSHSDFSTKDASLALRLKAPEIRPRTLSRPDTQPDEKSRSTTALGEGERPKMYTKPSGNAKPQEPIFLATRRKGFPQRVAMHVHTKAWSSSAMPGKKDNPFGTNQYHRTWVNDSTTTDKVVKWNSARLKQLYQDQDTALKKLKPHDELFATKANMKYWTHLEQEGSVKGGQEKVELYPPRQSGLHLKSGLYSGKFDNIRHTQLLIRTGWRPKGRLQEWQKDNRPMFDNRLKDDMIRRNDDNTREIAAAGYSIFRPGATWSCPQLGAEFVSR